MGPTNIANGFPLRLRLGAGCGVGEWDPKNRRGGGGGGGGGGKSTGHGKEKKREGQKPRFLGWLGLEASRQKFTRAKAQRGGTTNKEGPGTGSKTYGKRLSRYLF